MAFHDSQAETDFFQQTVSKTSLVNGAPVR